jgi:hypothetical protein
VGFIVHPRIRCNPVHFPSLASIGGKSLFNLHESGVMSLITNRAKLAPEAKIREGVRRLGQAIEDSNQKKGVKVRNE